MRIVPLDHLEHGRPTRVMVDGQPVLIALLDGIPHAMSDTCPHNGASLSDGILRDGCITCPAHFWRFSIVDGVKQSDSRVRIPTYRCWIEDGWVAIDLPARQPQRSMRQILLEHAREGRNPRERNLLDSDA